MTLVLDAGAFIALERDSRALWRRIKLHTTSAGTAVTHGGVVAQVWRGGARQATLARALRMVATVPLDEEVGRRAGVLLARSGLTDAIDAALVALCMHNDEILTSDPDDIGRLVEAARLRVKVIPV